jgi:hypothetical protein
MHAVYRGMVESGRLEELDREMGKGEWIPSGNGVAPVHPLVAGVTNEIMDQLHAAASKGDKRAARKALGRLRDWIANISV